MRAKRKKKLQNFREKRKILKSNLEAMSVKEIEIEQKLEP